MLKQSVCNSSDCQIFLQLSSGIATFFHHLAKRKYGASSVIRGDILSSVDRHWSSHEKFLNLIVDN